MNFNLSFSTKGCNIFSSFFLSFSFEKTIFLSFFLSIVFFFFIKTPGHIVFNLHITEAFEFKIYPTTKSESKTGIFMQLNILHIVVLPIPIEPVIPIFIILSTINLFLCSKKENFPDINFFPHFLY